MTKKEQNNLLIGGFLFALISGLIYLKSKKTVNKDLVNKYLKMNFAESNKKHFDSLNQDVKPIFKSFLDDINKLGYTYILTSSYRPTSEQIILKKKNPKNATAGFSTHEYGIGLDINLVKNGIVLNKNTPLSAWINSGVVSLAKNKYLMRWGGDFKGYLDPIHFDLGNKYDTKQLYKKALAIYGSPDKIQGNKMKLA